MAEQHPGRLTLVRADASRAAAGPHPEPEVGQIRVAHPDDGAAMRLLLVEVHEKHVQAMLCGDECEWVTDTDAVLNPPTTRLPRRILIHGDVTGSILKCRLGRLLAQIDPRTVERIALRGRGLDFTSTDLGRGRAILDESDPRWEWKLDKHRQLRQLRARASEPGWEIYRLGPREE
jgi:hypothetical protein